MAETDCLSDKDDVHIDHSERKVMCIETDVLIMGCGIAGASAAIRLAQEHDRHVVVITRSPDAEESNTHYAQGGIVARGVDDTAELLAQDIQAAGGGLCLEKTVNILAEEGPGLVERLLIDEAGVQFDADGDGRLAFTREGGHSARRILHVGDATGHAIETALIAQLRKLPNVELLTDLTAVDLITSSHHDTSVPARYALNSCYGAFVLDRNKGVVNRILAQATILATGGLGSIFKHTTNPEGTRGDGLAMAYRAGARVTNAEFIQFHPTTLALSGANNFLISEAVRGEGAKLYSPDGRHFMDQYAPQWGDLAPRDIVARAIHHEMVAHGYPHVLLDLGECMDERQIQDRFPTIYARCLEAGLDITREPIPVVPAAHYFCGGVQVDEWGRTTIENLYAVGEVSCTGVHGANRLASTSLLEGLVWGHRAAQHIAVSAKPQTLNAEHIPPWEDVREDGAIDPALILHDRQTIQNTMWLYVGLTRSTSRLARAYHDLNHLWQVIDQFYRTTRLNDDLIGLHNMAQTARIVAHAAWRNRSSCGVHYREDAQDDVLASYHGVGREPLTDTRMEF